LKFRSHGVSFTLDHGQIVGWLDYAPMRAVLPTSLTAPKIGSNYQGQGCRRCRSTSLPYGLFGGPLRVVLPVCCPFRLGRVGSAQQRSALHPRTWADCGTAGVRAPDRPAARSPCRRPGFQLSGAWPEAVQAFPDALTARLGGRQYPYTIGGPPISLIIGCRKSTLEGEKRAGASKAIASGCLFGTVSMLRTDGLDSPCNVWYRR